MATLNLKHKRIIPDVSASLIKNSITGEMKWRHRYVGSSKSLQKGRQVLKDYNFTEFKSIESFVSFIERKL